MKRIVALALLLASAVPLYGACPGYRRAEEAPDMATESMRTMAEPVQEAAPEVKAPMAEQDLKHITTPSGQPEEEDVLGEIFGEEIEGPEGMDEDLEDKFD